MEEIKWSGEEKKHARRIYDMALKKEFDEIIEEVKLKASKIMTQMDVWDLEDYITIRRKYINRRYDFKYSHLLIVFASLFRDKLITEEDLKGLSQDKIDRIVFVGKGFGE